MVCVHIILSLVLRRPLCTQEVSHSAPQGVSVWIVGALVLGRVVCESVEVRLVVPYGP